MTDDLGDIRAIRIEDEMRVSYLDYAMSVIVSRALPDVRDGLKPVHRRILYGMQEMGLQFNKKYTKSAKVVGHVNGADHAYAGVMGIKLPAPADADQVLTMRRAMLEALRRPSDGSPIASGRPWPARRARGWAGRAAWPPAGARSALTHSRSAPPERRPD